MKTPALLILFLLFAFPGFTQNYTTEGGSTTTGSSSFLCHAGTFNNKDNVNSSDNGDWSNFSLIAGVGCSYWLQSTLNGTAQAGNYAGYYIRASNLAQVLTGMQLQTYLNGTLQETASGGGLISLFASGEGYLSFVTTKPFDGVRIIFSGLASVFYDLDIFYGYGTVSPPGAVVLGPRNNLFPSHTAVKNFSVNNPAHEKIVFHMPGNATGPAQVTLSSLSGKIMIAKSVTLHRNQANSLFVAHVPGGLYLLRIEEPDGSITARKIWIE